MPGAEPGHVEQALLDLGAQQLEAARSVFAARRLPWESRVRVGSPAALIVEEAHHAGADLIVMGTRGMSPLRGLLVGSVAMRVAQTSPVPMWLAPPQAACPAALGRRLKLLCAVDGSTHADVAARWVARFAPGFGDVTVELVSVLPPLPPARGLAEDAALPPQHWSRRMGEAAIDSARQAMGQAGASAGARLCIGEAVGEIDRVAHETGAEVIVLGTRGLGSLGQALLGSVSGGLLQTTRHNVLIVP